MARIAGVIAAVVCVGSSFAASNFYSPVRVLQTIDSESGQRFITAVTEEPTQCRLHVMNGKGLETFPESENDVTLHRFDATPWASQAGGSSHPYSISCESRGDTEFESKGGVIKPAIAPNDSLKAIFVSDTQVYPEEVENVRHLINQFDPYTVLASGDIVHEGTEFHEWLALLDAYPFLKDVPLLSAFGDHEFKPRFSSFAESQHWNYSQYYEGYQLMTAGKLAARFLKPSALSSKRFYGAVRLGAIEIYLIDSILSAHAPGGSTIIEPGQVPYLMEQVEWLKSRLSESQKDSSIHFRVAVHHFPPFGSNDIATSPIPYSKNQVRVRYTLAGIGAFGFHEANQAYIYGDRETLPEANITSDDYVFRHLVPLFEKYNVRLDLNGHLHRFERLALHNSAYLTAGAAGGRIMEEAQYSTNSDSPRNFREHVRFLKPRTNPTIFTAEDIQRYGEVKIKVPPLMQRTITFLLSSSQRLRVYTCSFEGKVVDDFYIPVGQEPIRERPHANGGPCVPPQNAEE